MSVIVPKQRTFVITLLAILAGIAGVMSLLDAARYMGWLAFTVGDGLKFVLPQAQWFAAFMAAIVGVIYFVVASWLWNLNPSGWMFVVVITIVNLIFLVLALIGRTSFGDVAVQIVVNAVILIMALLPSTKAAFTPTLTPEAAAAATAASAAAQEKKDAAVDEAKQAAADRQAAAASAAAAAAAAAPAEPEAEESSEDSDEEQA